LTPNPIRKVLSTLRTFQVRHLLMGGQACVLYGGAEFSRDTDIALLAEPENLDRLRTALADLEARTIAVPDLSRDVLLRGHAVHFRCNHPGAVGMRLDVMAVMRGVDPFPDLWARRTTLETEDGATYDVMALPDLVQAKKTRRDKDWLMIQRLLEAHFAQNQDHPTPQQIQFWLAEARTPEILSELVRRFPDEAGDARSDRPAVEAAVQGDEAGCRKALHEEERKEREADEAYWRPRIRELEAMRHEKLNRDAQ